MKDITKQVKTAGMIFGKGFAMQIVEPGTLVVSTTAGVLQGMKYSGDFARGVKTGVVILAVIGAINGVRNVVRNLETIKRSGEEVI